MVLLQCLSLSAFAMPLISEPELSPAISEQGRLKAPSKNFRRWDHLVTLTDSKSAETVTEAPRLYSMCRGLSCHDINCNVEDHHEKNSHGQNHQEIKRLSPDNNMQNDNKRRQIVVNNKVRYKSYIIDIINFSAHRSNSSVVAGGYIFMYTHWWGFKRTLGDVYFKFYYNVNTCEVIQRA